ncbi:MAG: SIR2 family protein [Candidatus Binataceae bacterium]|nr:SIR2 family protein [Candidatus Binataceae bacterium]
MGDEISLYPPIPDRLRLAAKQGTLIPFIGAGVSQLGGCPGWDEFANATLRFFVQKGKLSHAQLDQLASLSARVKLAVALGLEQEHGLPVEFDKLLRPPDDHRKELGDRVYASLAKLASTFVTTNYDEWLDKMPSELSMVPSSAASPASDPPSTLRNVVYKPEDFDDEKLKTPNVVLHIHGSVRDRKSMVLTTADYLERYRSHRLDGSEGRENPFLTFLEILFKLKNILFVGYSLGELEVLEYVVQKARQDRPRNNEEPRHYILQGFFSHQLELKKSLERYYRNECGIGLLAFSRDTQDWRQLLDVVEYLSKEIPAGPVLGLQERREMEELLNG